MKATIYWAMKHRRRALHEVRFRAACWWLGQQVEFLEWRLKLEAVAPPAPSNPAPAPVGQGGPYVVLQV
ncbi:MAG: hypothetical protein E8D46_11715 [Nitrospira sp.]|nr:hypothetical protein [Nitrospira sp.]TKB73116.1 MAG: hypothetical protein E8D46_11715 [Nitrospira sp.]